MRAFRCPTCDQLLFFENSQCVRCQTEVGISPSTLRMEAVGPDRPRCDNAQLARCNWLVEDAPQESLCRSCRMTSVRPADDDPDGLVQFADAETAKRRVLYQLLDLGLPVDGLTLDFQLKSSTSEAVTTGHADGTITLDLAESDDTERTRRQEQLEEPYRTMVGHFRHELGHYYQGILLTRERDWDRARALFGDERIDYQAAMDRHYAEGVPAGWQDEFVSAYATMHPWEDWAETFAHNLHIKDTVQTATEFNLHVQGPDVGDEADDGSLEFDPDSADPRAGFRDTVDAWLPLTYALNQINRSMGRDDLYPFLLSEPVIDKLSLMDLFVRAATHRGSKAEQRAGEAAHGERPLDASDVAHPESGPAQGAAPGSVIPDGGPTDPVADAGREAVRDGS